MRVVVPRRGRCRVNPLSALPVRFVEKVIGGIRHQRDCANVRRLAAACGRRETACRVQAVDVLRPREKAAAGRTQLRASNFEQQPRNRPRFDKRRIV